VQVPVLPSADHKLEKSAHGAYDTPDTQQPECSRLLNPRGSTPKYDSQRTAVVCHTESASKHDFCSRQSANSPELGWVCDRCGAAPLPSSVIDAKGCRIAATGTSLFFLCIETMSKQKTSWQQVVGTYNLYLASGAHSCVPLVATSGCSSRNT
jgi:hypothetical protein